MVPAQKCGRLKDCGKGLLSDVCWPFLPFWSLQLSGDGLANKKPQFICCLIQVLVWMAMHCETGFADAVEIMFAWCAIWYATEFYAAECRRSTKSAIRCCVSSWNVAEGKMPLDQHRTSRTSLLSKLTVPRFCLTHWYSMHMPTYLVSWCKLRAHLLIAIRLSAIQQDERVWRSI